MPIEPGTPISQLYDNFRHLIEEFSEIGFSLYGHYQNSSKSEVDQSNEIHKLKAKIAVTNLSIRDTVEALSKHPDFKAPAPDGFDATLLRMVAAYDIQKMTVVGKGYFDSLKKILDLSRSSWFIAEATDILIMRNLEQNQDDQAVALYFELLEQAQLYEDAIPSLTRCAFYLTSKFALMGELEPARKVYDTMVRFGGSKASLSVVKKTGKAKGPAAADGRTQRPFLQLVSNKQLKDKSTWDDLGPRESERFDSEDIALIRAQAAVNLSYGYSIVGQASNTHQIYKKMPGLADIHDYVRLRSMIACNLICVYIHNRQWQSAMKIFNDLKKLFDSSDNSVYIAKATTEIIGCCSRNQLDKAETLYKSLSEYKKTPEFEIERCRAAGNLIYLFAEFGHYKQAIFLYEDLKNFDDSIEADMVRAKALTDLSTYHIGADIRVAEKYYEKLMAMDDKEELDEFKADAAHNMMIGFLNHDKKSKVDRVLNHIMHLPPTEKTEFVKACSIFNLVTHHINDGNFDKGRKVYGYFDELAPSDEVLIEKVKAMDNLTYSYARSGQQNKAIDLFNKAYAESLDFLAKKTIKEQEHNEMLADGVFNLENVGIKRKQIMNQSYPWADKSSSFPDQRFMDFSDFGMEDDLFDDDDDFEKVSDLLGILSQCSLNLVGAFVMSQLLKEAEYVHYKMVPLVDGRDDVMNYVSKSAAKVLVLALLKNNVNSAVKLYESYDELKNPTQVNFLKGLLAEQLICLLSPKKHHQLILRIYNDIKSFEPKSIFVASLARVASKVITAFAAAGEFEQAKEVYYSVVEMDIHQEFNSSLGQAGASLMKIYQTADWGSLEEAEKLYESICSLEGKPVVKSRLKAAKHLAQIFAQKGCADKAEDLRRATGRFTHVEGQAKKARKKAN